MGVIIVGLRPDDYRQLHRLAKDKGRRPQDLAGIYLERAVRRATAPAAVRPTDDHHDLVTTPADRSRG